MHINLAHRDCRNFAPIDVVKGICHRDKDERAADEPACTRFELLPRCRDCARFEQDRKIVGSGVCLASDAIPPFMAYADMVARLCEDYQCAPDVQGMTKA